MTLAGSGAVTTWTCPRDRRLCAEIAVQIPANTRVAAGVSTANDDGPRRGVEGSLGH